MCFVIKNIVISDRKVLLLVDMHNVHLLNLGFMEYMRGHNVVASLHTTMHIAGLH